MKQNPAIYLEFLAKGIAVGFLIALGFVVDFRASSLILGTGLLGLLLDIVNAKRHSKSRHLSNPLFTLLYLILQNPFQIVLGLVSAMTVGAIVAAFLGFWPWPAVGLALGVGILLGAILCGLHLIPEEQIRRVTILVAVGSSIWLAVWLLISRLDPNALPPLASHLLLGILIFYFLTWVGRAEESEADLGLACLLLGISLWCLLPGLGLMLPILIPVALFLAYAQFLLRDMQSYKAELQGFIAARQGETIQALSSLQRALALAPRNKSARETLWHVHQQIDLHAVHQDERLLKLIDFNMCLQRARELLFADQVTPQTIQEAKQLLNLVADQRPEQWPAVLYYRAVAHTHEGDFAKAETDLLTLLDPTQFGPEQQENRERILLQAWLLALVQHRELKKRVGEPLLHNGKRMDAIAAVEKAARHQPLDETGMELKQLLYSEMTMEDYNREAGTAPLQQASIFDHKYLYERGLESLDDPARWRRGTEWLRIAVRGQTRHAPAVMKLVADAAVKHGQPAEAAKALTELKAWAKLVGVKELSPESKAAYFSTIRQLGEIAYSEGRIDEALENLLLCIEDPNSAADTLRLIAECYEKKGDVLNTFWYNEQCLLYDAKNRTDLERRDRVYYSLTADDVRKHADKLGKIIDQNYLITKPRELLDLKNATAEQYEWARHLAELLLAIAPERIAGWTLLGRAQLRLGNSANAVEALEKGYQLGKAKKPSGDDVEAWYLACRILGDYYLQQERFAEALACFTEYQQSTKSGAETLYKLGQASERLGELAKAKKYYQHANMYDHPNKYEVNLALERIASRD